MTMWRDLKTLYAEVAGFARAHPLLFLVPVAFEFAQHVVEWRLGMFEGLAQARAIEDEVWRMGFGTAKVVALILCGYWMPRWLAQRGHLGVERAVPAARIPGSYWPLVTFQLVLTLAALWGPRLLERAGLVTEPRVLGVALVVQTVIALLWSGWTATAPVGRAVIGPIASTRLMARQLPRAFVFWLAVTLPLIAVHYGLNYLAFGKAAVVVWALIVADVLVVGFLGLLISGVPVFQIRRALGRG
jgi:hypothetical protein